MATSAVRKAPARKSSKSALKEMARLIEDHLSQYPEEEKNKRVERFSKRVNRATASVRSKA